jgi:hypothetical protein
LDVDPLDQLLFLAFLLIAFAPSIVAIRTRHPKRWLIIAVNFFLGGFGIGWIIACVILFTSRSTEAGEPDVPGQSVGTCSACGHAYAYGDLSGDDPYVRCSNCGSEMPRALIPGVGLAAS